MGKKVSEFSAKVSAANADLLLIVPSGLTETDNITVQNFYTSILTANKAAILALLNVADGATAFDKTAPGIIGGTTPGVVNASTLVTNALTMWMYSATVLDDGNFSLPTITNHAMGQIIAGNDEQRAQFSIDNAGNVFLWSNSSDNVAANADTDLMLCVGTSVVNPVVIKNRLGSSKKISVVLWYC